MKSGDNILQINEENLTGIASDQVATIIRRAGKEVKLVIAREMINDERTFESLPRQVRHLTLQAPTPKFVQTLSSNSSATAISTSQFFLPLCRLVEAGDVVFK